MAFCLTKLHAAYATLAVAAALSGCSADSTQTALPAQVGFERHIPVGSATAVDALARSRPVLGHSWMSPAAKSGRLLYVSDFTEGIVYAYAYPGGRLEGALYGAGVPRGMCLNQAGQIWITNGAGSVKLYAPGTIAPLKVRLVKGYDPVGCAVSPKTGELAVTSLNSRSGGQGSVTIFASAGGKGHAYTDSDIRYFDFAAYDAGGTLFVDGQDSGGAFRLAKFTGSRFKRITVTGATIAFPGGVQFAGAVLTVGDQASGNGNSVIYQMSEQGAVSGSTTLTGAADCVQYYIDQSTVACPNAGGPNAMLFAYPDGGNPLKRLKGSYTLPIGAVITPAQ